MGLLRQPGASVPDYHLQPTEVHVPYLTYLYTYEHGSWNAEGDASRDGEDPDSANTIPPPGSLLGTYRYHSNHTT